MALDTYLVNSVDLRSAAWRIETAEGLQDAPEFRGQDPVVPGLHGALDMDSDPTAPRRRYDVGSITFALWLKGVDKVTGLAPSDPYDLSPYNARLGELNRLFNARQLRIEHPRSDGTRTAVAKLAEPLRPVRAPASPWFGSVVAKCVIPGAFWEGPDALTASATLTTGGVLSLAAFAGCDAPITDAVLTFGPGNNPTLIQGGVFVGYQGVIPAGRQLLIDCGDWRTAAGTGGAWSGGGPLDANVIYEPGPSWFELDPTQTPPTAVLTHTGGGSMAVSLTARPKYLTS